MAGAAPDCDLAGWAVLEDAEGFFAAGFGDDFFEAVSLEAATLVEAVFAEAVAAVSKVSDTGTTETSTENFRTESEPSHT